MAQKQHVCDCMHADLHSCRPTGFGVSSGKHIRVAGTLLGPRGNSRLGYRDGQTLMITDGAGAETPERTAEPRNRCTMANNHTCVHGKGVQALAALMLSIASTHAPSPSATDRVDSCRPVASCVGALVFDQLFGPRYVS